MALHSSLSFRHAAQLESLNIEILSIGNSCLPNLSDVIAWRRLSDCARVGASVRVLGRRPLAHEQIRLFGSRGYIRWLSGLCASGFMMHKIFYDICRFEADPTAQLA